MADWFCPSLLVPEYERDVINDWVFSQDWPEGTKFKDPETYHITLLYSPVNHQSKLARLMYQKLQLDQWDHSVRVNGVEQFTPAKSEAPRPIVLTLHGALLDLTVNHYRARARELGLFYFDRPYRPHVTVAEIPPGSNFDTAALDLPGPESALGLPLKFTTAGLVELHNFYNERKAACESD